MKKAIILHGTQGSPASNWFRWLESELKSRELEVWLPELPYTERPSSREHADFVRSQSPFPIDEQTLIIGHSSGAILGLIVAQESARLIGGLVAVSVFDDGPSPATKWEANDRVFDVSFDFEAVKAHTQKLLFVHSDNDPYVPLDQARRVADGCQAELVVWQGQGHFNLQQNQSYREFPQLIEILESRRLL